MIDSEVVKRDGRALEFIKNQTPEIVFTAVKRCKGAIKFTQEEFRFLFDEEFKGLTLDEIKDKAPEMFL